MKKVKELPLELYIHIPFCVKKCDYCDFLSGPAGPEAQQKYIDALLAEIDAADSENRIITSVFIGGGTPSVLKASLIFSVMEKIKEKFQFAEDAEITIEVNPGTLTEEKITAYLQCGINRLSLGLQSVQDKELKLLGRIHTYQEFLESYFLARKYGFKNINIDLMSAIPEQTYEGWIHNLRTVAELNPEHISAYSLIVEEGTPFYDRELQLPDEDTEYQMYEDTASVLKEYGYEQYEISNYAKEGYASRHNLGYWERKEYLGLGLGASSCIDNTRFSNISDMEQYLKYSHIPSKIRENTIILNEAEQMEEFMFLGLRKTEGISEKEFFENFHQSVETVYGDVLKKYTELSLLKHENGRIFLSRQGIHVSNQIMAEFLL